VILEVPTTALKDAHSKIADARHRAGKLQAATATIKAGADSQAGEVARRQATLAQERQTLAKTQGGIVELLAEIPVTYQPHETTLEAIDTQLRQARDDKELLSRQWRELTSLQLQLKCKDQEAADLAERRQREVTHPAARLRQSVLDTVVKHDALAQLLGQPAASTGDPAASAGEQATWAKEVVGSARNLLEKARHHLDELAHRLQQCDDKTRDVLQAAPTDGMELDDAVETVTGTAAIAARKRDEATAQVAEAEDLDRRVGEARPHVEALGELVALLKDGKFVAAVVRERQRSLLGTATGLLRQMTLGRFGFGPEFQIFDAHTGVLRDVRTLSGGETFQASLALALAVVEQASSTGGRADALFLDEGFGTLDQNALAYALDALTTQVNAGRLVVVISHMRAVAQHVPALLKVEESPAGSTIRWADDAERADLADESYVDNLQE
jgi:exonuclease SbcC